MKEVITLRPASPYNEELLGVIAVARGEFNDAIRHQKRALQDKSRHRRVLGLNAAVAWGM
jgi:hypothetical protein